MSTKRWVLPSDSAIAAADRFSAAPSSSPKLNVKVYRAYPCDLSEYARLVESGPPENSKTAFFTETSKDSAPDEWWWTRPRNRCAASELFQTRCDWRVPQGWNGRGLTQAEADR